MNPSERHECCETCRFYEPSTWSDEWGTSAIRAQLDTTKEQRA